MQAVRAIPRLCKTVGVPQRNASHFIGSVISGPPTQRVSFAEKVGLGSIMIGSFLIVPVWILLHMEEYKGNK